MHETVQWDMQTDKKFEDKTLVKVPFWFSTTGQERFLQNYFLNDVVDDPEGNLAESVYNEIPRGIAEMGGISIDQQNISNKFIRVIRQYQDKDGELNPYSVEVFWVPLEIDFSVKIYVSSVLDQLKCSKSVISNFYKASHFSIDDALVKIPSSIKFPDSVSTERAVEFGFDDKKEYYVNFDCILQTVMPVYDERTKIFKGDRIEGFSQTVKIHARDTIPSTIQFTNNSGVTGPTALQTESVDLSQSRQPSWPIEPAGDVPPMGGTGY